MTSHDVLPNHFFNQAEALDLLHQLHKTTLQLSVRSFSAAISACARSGQWQQSLELLNQMEGAKLAANIITYNAAISACEKCCLSSKITYMQCLTLEVYRRPQECCSGTHPDRSGTLMFVLHSGSWQKESTFMMDIY